jgi:hypothetical protein
VLSEVGVEPASYATINRRLPIYARPSWRQSLATASAAHAGLGPASLVTDVTVVADAGMISEANQVALQAAGLSFILGTRIPFVPDVVREWGVQYPDEQVPDGLVLTQPWPATGSEKSRGIPDRVIYYQFRQVRARRMLRGIDEQIAKAERAVDGHAPVKRNRYIQLSGATKSVNRTLEAKTRARAGWKGYTTNLTTASSEFVIDAYHQLWRIEKSFRMSKHDLQARTIYHHIRESIEAHLSIVVAALAIVTGSSTKPAGASRNSCELPAATAPSRSKPAPRSSPPPTHYPTTSATRSSRSAPAVCTNLSQVGSSPSPLCSGGLRRNSFRPPYVLVHAVAPQKGKPTIETLV